MDKSDSKKLFKKIVGENQEKFIRVKIPDKKINEINGLVKKIIIEKKKEIHHKIDGEREFKRFYTGFLGEAAIEEIFKVNIIDWDVGESKKYNYPDLRSLGINIGIKTSEMYNFPIIFKQNNYPQIINFRYGGNIVYVCGIATEEILNKYQNDDLILSPKLRLKGTKTGFWGFDKLISLKSIKNIYEINEILQGE